MLWKEISSTPWSFFRRQSTSYLDRLTQACRNYGIYHKIITTTRCERNRPCSGVQKPSLKQVANTVEIMTNYFVKISHSGCSPLESCVMIRSNGEWMRGHRSYVRPIGEVERERAYIYCQLYWIRGLKVDRKAQDLLSKWEIAQVVHPLARAAKSTYC